MGRCAGAGPAFGVDVAMRLPLRFSDRGGVLGGHKLGPDARPVSRAQVAARHGAFRGNFNGDAVLNWHAARSPVGHHLGGLPDACG